MRNFITDEYTVAAYFLPALINGDYSGLSEDEHDQLDAWAASLKSGGHFSTGEDEGSSFRRCCVCQLMADTQTLLHLHSPIDA